MLLKHDECKHFVWLNFLPSDVAYDDGVKLFYKDVVDIGINSRFF